MSSSLDDLDFYLDQGFGDEGGKLTINSSTFGRPPSSLKCAGGPALVGEVEVARLSFENE